MSCEEERNTFSLNQNEGVYSKVGDMVFVDYIDLLINQKALP